MERTPTLALLLLYCTLAAAANRLEYDYFKYHKMEEITKWKLDIATANKDLVEIIEYGKTYENRSIDLLKIGVPGSNKKIIWMDCGIHAREWIAPAFCQYFIKTILDMYKTDYKMQLMMKNMDFYVTPVLNVDGYIFSWHNESTRLWRKNRTPGPSDCSCIGTDLNRNFYANWGTVGVSSDCCSQIYPGQGPVSEPEAQAVTKFMGNIAKDVLAFLTIHSYGQLLLIPYGHPEVIAPNQDELMEVGLAAAEAIEKVHGMKYKVGTSPTVLYANSGSSRDWARLQGVPYCFTFELRDNGTHGFELPQDQIKPAVEEAYSGAMHIITHAHDKTFQGEYDYFRYHNMEEINSWKTEMATTNKDIVSIVEYGKTYEKRTIDLLKIGVPGNNKKIIWMDCGIHAREWISPAFCQYFVKTILEMYKTDSKMQQMMKNIDFYVTPVLNVDGYTYTWLDQSNRLWRKNRTPGPSDCNCTGTDLNRNFKANWGTVGVSFNCCSILYPGQGPASELETQAVTQIVGKVAKDVLAFLTIHSYGQLLLIPYGHPDHIASNQDELMEVGLAAAAAIEKVHGMQYKVGTGPKILYEFSGSSSDWAHLQGIPYSYTFELRDNGTHGFELPEEQIKPAVEEALRGALHIITHAHDKAFINNKATATGAATIWVTLLAAVVTKWFM